MFSKEILKVVSGLVLLMAALALYWSLFTPHYQQAQIPAVVYDRLPPTGIYEVLYYKEETLLTTTSFMMLKKLEVEEEEYYLLKVGVAGFEKGEILISDPNGPCGIRVFYPPPPKTPEASPQPR